MAEPSSTRPWIRGPVALPKALRAEIEAHAIEAYPSECCGFVLGPVGDAPALDEVLRQVNEADRYHARDPERFPRTSRTYFKINELKAARTFDAQEHAGRPVKVIYHSHCDAGAHFSEEDAATFAAEGTLLWPCAFLVVSVTAAGPQDLKLWVHRPGTNDFEEGELRVS